MVGGTLNGVQGNFIGTDVTGTLPLGNTGVGVENDGIANSIGGDTEAARNIIAANNRGISLGNGFENRVQGNFIGTDRTGTVALPNPNSGMSINAGSNNVIGGLSTTPGGTSWKSDLWQRRRWFASRQSLFSAARLAPAMPSPSSRIWVCFISRLFDSRSFRAGFQRRWLRPLWRALFLSPNDAAAAVAGAAGAPAPADPACYTLGGEYVSVPSVARDADARQRLWTWSEHLIGVDF